MNTSSSSYSLGNRVRRCQCFLICIVLSARDVFSGICNAAKAGRLLPRLTLVMPCHAILHWILFISTSSLRDALIGTAGGSDTSAIIPKTKDTWQMVSLYVMITNVLLNAIGYTILLLLYRHSVQTIFNRKTPTITRDDRGCIHPSPHPAVQSFNTHLLMLRPLEILFRFITAPLRVLPDVIIVGETRCGTTNLCGHITSLSTVSSLACCTPFCPWAHPELDHKESFYFVGHYLGIVDPYFYRMAFPLKITKWWEEKILGNIFFCFDGCAQYLTSPTAPYLIANAYKGSDILPPVLVACVRTPTEQAISWWKYENNAILWGESIGLKEWNTDLRSNEYPPKNIAEAITFSQSEFVKKSYSDAELLVVNLIQQKFNGNTQRTTQILPRLLTGGFKCLPPWAMTWPAGQLSTIGRSGHFAHNIKRYNDVFSAAFAGIRDGIPDRGNSGYAYGDKRVHKIAKHASNNQSEKSSACKIGFVHIVPLESQANGKALKSVMSPILLDVFHRRNLHSTTIAPIMGGIHKLYTRDNFEMTRRNSSTLSNLEMEPSQKDIAMLNEHFEDDIAWYSSHAKLQY